MNKGQLIEQVAQKTGLTKAAAEKAINAYNETVADALAHGEKLLSLDLAVSKLQKDLRVKEEIRQQVKLSRFRQQK